ncbi:MAG: 2-isopropylmalate synthase [Verrucomicrobia bacterium]|nr:MAG: 2-isopropylmalate synthase [Verrucomicrobiota bacterium]
MKRNPDRVVIFDTTLRDGEQCPGASMGVREKLEVARQLARLGVDIIEAGFPVASAGDFEAVKTVASEVKGPRIAALARCVPADIEACAAALAPAGKRARIHVFLATSEIHRKYKLRKARSEIIRQAVAGVEYARRFCEDVQFSPEDASRTEPEFLAEVIRAVLDAGATTINIPDTVGYAIPSEFGSLIAYLFEHVEGLDRITVHVHCHNDLGLAVANSLAAVQNGARGIECTINGIGERAGNCALEEVVMALKTRQDLFRVQTGINTREIYRTSRLVSQLTGMMVQRNKAIVGANAFAHEAGIHQDGILKERSTYEIMKPEDVGIPGSELVLGKHSGRHAFRHHLAKLGFDLAEKELEEIYQAFIALADKKKHIYDDDIVALVQEHLQEIPPVYVLEYIHVISGNTAIPTATVRLRKENEILQDSACGDGPVDAALKAVDRMSGISGRLVDYSLQAITSGKDALGEVSVQVEFGDRVVSGKGSSTDIIEASIKAYINCLNRYLFLEGQGRKSPRRRAASGTGKTKRTSSRKRGTQVRRKKRNG